MQRAAVIGGYVSQSQERNAHATAAMGESPIELMQAHLRHVLEDLNLVEHREDGIDLKAVFADVA